jgi:uncharacterized protein
MCDDTGRPDVEDDTGRPELPAGGFSDWLHRTRRAQLEGGGACVPCGECIACCTSSYFIHVGPGESRTLRHIPQELLFPAPGRPRGNVVLGYDEQGRCPMLVDGRCSIYEHRPRTCSDYDCRVFAAAGIQAGDGDKQLIDQRARRWRFSYPTERDRGEHLAVQAAAKFLRERAGSFPAGVVPGNPAQLAVLAIKVFDVFIEDPDAPDHAGRERSDVEIAAAVMERLRRFEAGGAGRPAGP